MRKEVGDSRLKQFLKILGRNVQGLRGQMSQSELARLAGVSRSTIYAIERGQSVQFSNLYKVAMALKIDPGRLCTEEISDDGFRDNLRKIMRELLRELLGEIFVTQIPVKKS